MAQTFGIQAPYRKGGAMLAGMIRHEGGRPAKLSHDVTVSLTDTGIDRKTSSRWQSIASIPEDVFEKFVRETVDSGKELTKAASRAGWAPWSGKRVDSQKNHDSRGIERLVVV